MKTKLTCRAATALLSLAILIHLPAVVLAQGTAFTYQGRLDDNGAAANGAYDLTFRLFLGPTGNPPASVPLTNSATAVSNGLFTVGEDDRHISTVDADGVALAAIQGLNLKLTEALKRRDAENAALKQRLDALEKLVSRVALPDAGGAR